MKKLFILFLCVTGFVSAQNTTGLFTKANNFYESGKYDQAIDSYKKIIEKGEVSSELYYNLGNCYYKLKDVAPAIYNYEMSLKLDDSNMDVKNNLIFANLLVVDKIDPLPKTFLQQIDENFLQKLSYKIWSVLAVLFSVLASALFLVYYFSVKSNKKKLFFIGSMVSVFLLVSMLFISFQQYNKTEVDIYAIVFSKEVKAQSEPVNSSGIVFTIHEGTKVKILDIVDDWKKIKIVDGKIGWVLSKGLKDIKI